MIDSASAAPIYHNGRTYAEHSAWLAALTGDEYRLAHMPIGHLFNIAIASWFKRFLVTFSTTVELRQRTLNAMADMAFGPVTPAAIAAIEPADDTSAEIIRTITALPKEVQTRAFQDGDVFRLLAQLNGSLREALRLCTFAERIPGE